MRLQGDEGFDGLTTEVLVVGGGPAGLAAAIAARKKGFHVIVADGARTPIDKACGEGLPPGTLAALRELGIDIQPRDGQIFRRIRFIDGTTSAKAVVPGEGGVGVRRTVLHQKMVERAEECGIELLWNAPVTCLATDSVIAGGKSIRAKWIVGADGGHSRVRRWSGLEPRTHCKFRFAQRNVPAGRYMLHVWHQSSLPETLNGFTREVSVSPAASSLGVIRLAQTTQAQTHKNKYGRDYEPPAPANPAYKHP